MVHYAKLCGFTNFNVTQGMNSKKLFKYDGHDIFSPIEIKRFKRIQFNPLSLEPLKNFIKESSPLIISLKPPREFIKLWDTDKTIFNNCIMFGYMSFNLRCLMREWSHKKIIEFLNSFKECYFYETFHSVGENNIISCKDIDMKKLPKFVYDLMIYWNKGLIEGCRETCESYKDRKDKRGMSKFKRNLDIIKAIEDYKGEQFVNADCGLILSLLQPGAPFVKKSLKFNEAGYSFFEEGGKINVISVDDKKKYRESQIKQLKKMLE